MTSPVIIFSYFCTERFKYKTWVLIIAAEKIYSTLQKVNVKKNQFPIFNFPFQFPIPHSPFPFPRFSKILRQQARVPKRATGTRDSREV